MKAIDLTDQKIGRLTAIRRLPKNAEGTVWLWRCECGTEKVINLRNIRQGKTRSCGCLGNERRLAASTTHGMTGSGAHRSWTAAKSRCFTPSNNRYPKYGGAGITMCDRWRDSFADFLEDMGERPDGATLDRIDVMGNYEPGNCRWATATEQACNRRSTIDTGKPGRSLRAFAAETGLPYGTLRYHIAAGRSLAYAVERARHPTRSGRRSSRGS